MTAKKKVASTIKGCGSKNHPMMHERRLLAKRRMLEEQAQIKQWELEAIFQMIYDTDKKIEEQREKQMKVEK